MWFRFLVRKNERASERRCSNENCVIKTPNMCQSARQSFSFFSEKRNCEFADCHLESLRHRHRFICCHQPFTQESRRLHPPPDQSGWNITACNCNCSYNVGKFGKLSCFPKWQFFSPMFLVSKPPCREGFWKLKIIFCLLLHNCFVKRNSTLNFFIEGRPSVGIRKMEISKNGRDIFQGHLFLSMMISEETQHWNFELSRKAGGECGLWILEI